MIIDGHAHACGEYLTAEKIEKKLDCAGVDTVLLTPGQYGSRMTYGLKRLAEKDPLGDVVSKNNRTTSFLIKLIGAVKQIPKGNEYVYELKRALPTRVKQCYWVTKENFVNVPKDYDRMKFDTVKFHQCWENFDFDDELFTKTVELATEKDIPVFVHVRNLEQMQKLISYIREHPKATVTIGHLYGMELFLKDDLTVFKNTYFDLSNLYFVSKERIMLAYRHFGAEHLLLGSDTPYGKQSLELTKSMICDLPIPETDKNLILGENLARLLKI